MLYRNNLIFGALVLSVILGCEQQQVTAEKKSDVDPGVAKTEVMDPVTPAEPMHSISAIPSSLSDGEKALVAWVDEHQQDILEELRVHVEMNTGTDNVAGIDQYRNVLEGNLQALGFGTETIPVDGMELLDCAGSTMEFADHLLATRSAGAGTKLFLNGHMDTVFSSDDDFQKLEVLPDGVLKGPGVIDMKGGMVVLINALRALQSQGLLDDSNMTVFLNSDEEVGSLSSRPIIERLARAHDLGLVFEGTKDNKMTRLRKGLGQARIKVTGRESHAGSAHEHGVSAVLEMAHKVIDIEKLTDYEKKVTVNTGVISGGEKRNTVSGCADTYIDMRYPNADAGRELEQGLSEIAARKYINNEKYPDFPQTEYWSLLHRPAKEGNEVVDQLIAEAMGLSSIIGEPIVGASVSGGGTDGSIAQSVGLPTLDTFGVNGTGAHSSREETTVQSLLARTKLAAVMISRVLEDQ